MKTILPIAFAALLALAPAANAEHRGMPHIKAHPAATHHSARHHHRAHPHHHCHGMASGTAHRHCGTRTGGPVGGLH